LRPSCASKAFGFPLLAPFGFYPKGRRSRPSKAFAQAKVGKTQRAQAKVGKTRRAQAKVGKTRRGGEVDQAKVVGTKYLPKG